MEGKGELDLTWMFVYIRSICLVTTHADQMKEAVHVLLLTAGGRTDRQNSRGPKEAPLTKELVG